MPQREEKKLAKMKWKIQRLISFGVAWRDEAQESRRAFFLTSTTSTLTSHRARPVHISVDWEKRRYWNENRLSPRRLLLSVEFLTPKQHFNHTHRTHSWTTSGNDKYLKRKCLRVECWLSLSLSVASYLKYFCHFRHSLNDWWWDTKHRLKPLETTTSQQSTKWHMEVKWNGICVSESLPVWDDMWILSNRSLPSISLKPYYWC